MTPAALLLAITPLAGVVADVKGSLVLSDFSQLLVRPADTGVGQSEDLVTAPQIGTFLDAGHTRITLGYGPRFSLYNAFSDQSTPLLFHVASLGITYSESARASFSLTESGSFGKLSLVTQALAPTPGLQTQPTTTPQATTEPNIPQERTPPVGTAIGTMPTETTMSRVNLLTTQLLYTASESTNASMSYAWSPRTRSAFSLGYGITGGFGASAQQTLPQQHTAVATTSTSYSLSRVETVSGSLVTSYTTLSNGLDAWIAGASAGWKRALSSTLGATLQLGLSFTDSEDTPGHRQGGLLPTGGAGLGGTLLRGPDYSLSFQVGSALAPVISPLTGVLQPMIQANTTLTAASHYKTTAGVSFDAGQTLPLDSQFETRVVGAGASVSQGIGDIVGVTLQYRSFWQQAKAVMTNLPRLWTLSIGLSLRAPPIAF